MRRMLIVILMLALTSCSFSSDLGETSKEVQTTLDLVDEGGKLIKERFKTPEGFERVEIEDNSFGDYLRNLTLKPHGAVVKYYDGREKSLRVHEAVIDIDVGTKDLQQCADAAMRLRAEYLYSRGLYDKIHFNFTNGFRADYSKWMKGNRISVQGNNVHWTSGGKNSNDYQSFRKYLDMVFSYAGTLSLSKEMKKVQIADMQIGDVFIIGGSPGHCVIILDMAENKATGERLFMLGQSYMPAQDIHVLKNPNSLNLSPWYSVNFGEELVTPEWKFRREHLMRFPE